MNNKALIPAAAAAAVVLVLLGLGQPFYIVDEREQVVVSRFDRPVRVIVGDAREDFEALKQEIIQSATRGAGAESNVDIKGIAVDQGAGLYMKMPFIDNVEVFPDTVLEYDAAPEELNTLDLKKLIVDNFARWRIENPLLFRIRLRTEAAARSRLDDIIYSEMRTELARSNLIEIIRTTKDFSDIQGGGDDLHEDSLITATTFPTLKRSRDEIMDLVTERSNAFALENFGIRILDVRIKRAELLPANLQAVFLRMQAERERISKGYRSEGGKEAAIIRGDTDKKVTVMLAEAEAEAQRIRGEGDAESLRIYAEAFGGDPELFRYMRSLEVIGEATPLGSEFIVGLDSSIYKLLRGEE